MTLNLRVLSTKAKWDVNDKQSWAIEIWFFSKDFMVSAGQPGEGMQSNFTPGLATAYNDANVFGEMH